ncbi:Serine/threonine-protein kinase [Salix suchowensis]|nr:Serine/threonine-protein kinase [Salix suchowensis]
MDHGAHKVLESATFRTLHAQNFSRASTQASYVLTDLLERYLTLLSSTAGKFAEHAGRGRSIGVRDAVCALDELGVGIDELKDWCVSEGGEMSGSFGLDCPSSLAHLADGLKQDTDDAFPLHYRPLDDITNERPPDDESEADADAEEEDYETMMDTDVNRAVRSQSRASSPSTSTTRPSYSLPQIQTTFSSPHGHQPLTLLCLQYPTPVHLLGNAHARLAGRPRSTFPISYLHFLRCRLTWDEWLMERQLETVTAEVYYTNKGRATRLLVAGAGTTWLDIGLVKTEIQGQTSISNPTAPVVAAAVSAAQVVTSSDYLSQVPYSESTLSSVPEWHLPQPAPPPSTAPISTRLATPRRSPLLSKRTTTSSRIPLSPTPRTHMATRIPTAIPTLPMASAIRCATK